MTPITESVVLRSKDKKIKFTETKTQYNDSNNVNVKVIDIACCHKASNACSYLRLFRQVLIALAKSTFLCSRIERGLISD